ncbi:MAG: hypothetical protein JSV42_17430 [Chloroflexota bacterium]|nr:MAG: hypothetical protein JSV42_17430 [Chloroflexota bacterium]
MNSIQNLSQHTLTSRADFLQLLDAAMFSGSIRFARQISLTWLAYYPGDLPVRLKYCQLLAKAGQIEQAIQQLTDLSQADPEYLDAWIQLANLLQGNAQIQASTDNAFSISDCQSVICALGGKINVSAPLPSWSNFVLQSRIALARDEIELAEENIHQVLVVDPLPPIMAVIHLAIMKGAELPSIAIQNLAEFYRQRFPKTIAPVLYLAESLMDGGEPERAVALLHRAASLDVTGQVALRIWGSDNPYQNLWPDKLEAPVNIPIPAPVAALFGWNRLPQQASSSNFVVKQSETGGKDLSNRCEIRSNQKPGIISPAVIHLGEPNQRIPVAVKPGALSNQGEPVPESLISIQTELERVAAKINRRPLAQKDGRFPIYVVFTAKSGLSAQYGTKHLDQLDREMKRVVSSISARQDWGSILVYADDPSCMSAFDLNPVSPKDPWSLKLVIADLDKFLRQKGAMIGALLIVGGPEIVPYHNLPNPVDDVDFEVPSDNPYATRDENYFIPEWPVGRLPGGIQDDPESLIYGLRQISDHHARLGRKRNWLQRWWDRIQFRRFLSTNGNKSSWGYSAAIWRRASLSVFRPIGAPHTLYVSPPVQSTVELGDRKNGFYPFAKLGYFNLHGLEDSGNWYGQRDPSEPSELPDYPVALRPQDVTNNGHAPRVVFSEACYGANIVGKNREEALSLTFLASGSQTVVGSTCTSYGSITPPLIAADLLGHAFWKFLRDGYPAGEALRRAKIHLAKEMHQRQGYLDGEDQKTLISFLLLGDPLAQFTEIKDNSKTIMRAMRAPGVVNTVCDRNGNCQELRKNIPHPLYDNPPIPSKTLAQVKSIVEQYLPGMTDANVQCTRSHATCSGEGHTCPTSLHSPKAKNQKIPEHNVVTLSKHVEQSNTENGATQIHHHYARVTIDDNGKIIKLAVSR